MSGTDTVSTKIKDKRICFLEKQTGEKKKKKKEVSIDEKAEKSAESSLYRISFVLHRLRLLLRQNPDEEKPARNISKERRERERKPKRQGFSRKTREKMKKQERK